jgi:hypothetical protein
LSLDLIGLLREERGQRSGRELGCVTHLGSGRGLPQNLGKGITGLLSELLESTLLLRNLSYIWPMCSTSRNRSEKVGFAWLMYINMGTLDTLGKTKTGSGELDLGPVTGPGLKFQ